MASDCPAPRTGIQASPFPALPARSRSGLRPGPHLATLSLLLMAACASQPGTTPHDVAEEVAAPAEALPPVDPSDRWGQHIREASLRFDVPEQWIRTVMRIESGGRTTVRGKPITSPKGAMGLMQVIPGTYDEMRAKYNLGPDPYEPRNNILAGTAYIREMYELFGAPGFLGAYNCGPACYGDFVAGIRRLPAETRNYIKKGSTQVAMAEPKNRTLLTREAPAPAAPAPDDAIQVASAVPLPPEETLPAQRFVIPAQPAPRHKPAAAPVVTTAAATAPVVAAPAVAAPAATTPIIAAAAPLPQPAPLPAPARPAPPVIGNSLTAQFAAKQPNAAWGVQVGAFRSRDDVNRVVANARSLVPDLLAHARPNIDEIQTSGKTLFRTQLLGLSEAEATTACQKLAEKGASCVRVRLT